MRYLFQGWDSCVWPLLGHSSTRVLHGTHLGQPGGHHHRAGGPQELQAEAVGEMGVVGSPLCVLGIHYCGFCSTSGGLGT